MCNEDIRCACRSHGVKLWEVAEQLGMTDSNFSRKLRQELPQKDKQEIFDIIDCLAGGKEYSPPPATDSYTETAEEDVCAIFCGKLKRLIVLSGISQAKLARDLNMSPQRLNRYVHGKRCLDYNTLCEVADYFEVSVDYLFGR